MEDIELFDRSKPHNGDYDYPLRELPDRLIEAIDLIKALRIEGNKDTGYDPCDYDYNKRKKMREHADKLELELELRLGWTK